MSTRSRHETQNAKGARTSSIANTPETRIAEKVCAVMQTYATGPSSRVKDLADLATSMLNERVDADKLARRLDIETAFRHMDSIEKFAVPVMWKTSLAGNYRRMAREAKLPQELESVETAEAIVAEWLGPILCGSLNAGAWNPESQTWQS